jgi:two-component system cell cycle response regulator
MDHDSQNPLKDELTQPALFREAPQLDTERQLSIPVPVLDARATLTVISGMGAGRIVALSRDVVLLGRGPAADLQFEDVAISRSHARVTCEPHAYVLEDLGSTNGTFLHGTHVSRAHLASGDRFQLGPRTVMRFAVADQLERQLLTNLVESSTRDALTGAFNRAFFDQRIEAEIAYARRHGTKVAILLLDLDGFKTINDTHGHAAGDQVLRAVANEIRRTLRVEDLFARYGGEEFAILARAATNLDALRLAERVRIGVAALRVPLPDGGSATVTVSIGVARHSEGVQPCTPADLMKLADARLYRAKASGRNVTCMTD